LVRSALFFSREDQCYHRLLRFRRSAPWRASVAGICSRRGGSSLAALAARHAPSRSPISGQGMEGTVAVMVEVVAVRVRGQRPENQIKKRKEPPIPLQDAGGSGPVTPPPPRPSNHRWHRGRPGLAEQTRVMWGDAVCGGTQTCRGRPWSSNRARKIMKFVFGKAGHADAARMPSGGAPRSASLRGLGGRSRRGPDRGFPPGSSLLFLRDPRPMRSRQRKDDSRRPSAALLHSPPACPDRPPGGDSVIGCGQVVAFFAVEPREGG